MFIITIVCLNPLKKKYIFILYEWNLIGADFLESLREILLSGKAVKWITKVSTFFLKKKNKNTLYTLYMKMC